ncbi:MULTISPECIES: hypothetical protein [Bacillus cereus group]|nr:MULTISPECIES: hypothetical protein [Bacillus cereus group]MCU5186762.1 hypothetical protein [Bacillus cereus]MDA2119056.1 hypothetical protein [Bacillus cereus]MDA2136198.1 hypothetical protein [Bacillus cereus]MEC3569975.1 hypothetical protein [Bacillus thuringiensis]MED0826791.1 hypothetical protein [Bacillus pacificus]
MEFKELMKYIEENKEKYFEELMKSNKNLIKEIALKIEEEK